MLFLYRNVLTTYVCGGEWQKGRNWTSLFNGDYTENETNIRDEKFPLLRFIELIKLERKTMKMLQSLMAICINRPKNKLNTRLQRTKQLL